MKRLNFAIARTVKSDVGNELSLYIGGGEQLAFAGQQLSAGEGRKASKAIP